MSMYLTWAKTDQRKGSGATVQQVHLVPYHNLDVAASLYALLEADPTYLRQLARLLEQPREAVLHDLPVILAQHDVGKYTGDFQTKAPSACEFLKTSYQAQDPTGQPERHDMVLWSLFHNHAWRNRRDTFHYIPYLEAQGFEPPKLLTELMRTVAGHHGYALPHSRKIGVKADPHAAALQWSDDALERLKEHLRGLYQVFGAFQMNLDTKPQQWSEATHLIAGLFQISDWVGSSQEYFPLQSDVMPLPVYWETCALPRAREAVRKINLLPSALRDLPNPYRSLLPYNATPRPMQQAALEARTEESSDKLLYVIEDGTGSGKTETALMLAKHIIQTHENVSGLYLALPTRASADGLYQRLSTFASTFFEPWDPGTVSLIHSSKKLNPTFRQLREQDARQHASISAPNWINKSNRTALLSQISVGTVDQVLLGVVSKYFSHIRLAALTRSVIIIDEVHACDTVMAVYLKTLMSWCGRLNLPVILMTATLADSLRNELIQAYNGEVVVQEEPSAFPLLTRVQGQTVESVPVEAHEEREYTLTTAYATTPKDPNLNWTPEEEEIALELVERASQGEAVVWFRNTVGDAQRTFERIATLVDNEPLLMHSQYIRAHRALRDREVMMAFGPQCSEHRGSGRIVISTQVLQESMDVSFDWGVSDLCDADLLLQRMGRILRHSKDAKQRHFKVFMPEVVEEPPVNWVRGVNALSSTGYVYTNTTTLWTTAKLIEEHPVWRYPQDIRYLLDTVATAEPPKTLRTSKRKQDRTSQDKKVAARASQLDWDKAYSNSKQASKWDTDSPISTRDIIPGRTWFLCREEQSRLVPLHQRTAPYSKSEAVKAWGECEISIYLYRVHDAPLREDHQRMLEEQQDLPYKDPSSLPSYGNYLVMSEIDYGLWRGEGLTEEGDRVVFFYDYEKGLFFS
jgi:CRISPR-associated endonuclease/helicase Cas3